MTRKQVQKSRMIAKRMDLLSFEIELKDLLLKFNAKLTIIDNKLMVNGKCITI